MGWIERWQPCKKWSAIAQRIRKVRRRHAGLGCRFAAALLSHYWAQPSKRASLALATVSRPRCVLLTRNIRALSGRLLIGISTANLRTVGSTASCNNEAGQAVTPWFQAESLNPTTTFFKRRRCGGTAVTAPATSRLQVLPPFDPRATARSRNVQARRLSCVFEQATAQDDSTPLDTPLAQRKSRTEFHAIAKRPPIPSGTSVLPMRGHGCADWRSIRDQSRFQLPVPHGESPSHRRSTAG